MNMMHIYFDLYIYTKRNLLLATGYIRIFLTHDAVVDLSILLNSNARFRVIFAIRLSRDNILFISVFFFTYIYTYTLLHLYFLINIHKAQQHNVK